MNTEHDLDSIFYNLSLFGFVRQDIKDDNIEFNNDDLENPETIFINERKTRFVRDDESVDIIEIFVLDKQKKFRISIYLDCQRDKSNRELFEWKQFWDYFKSEYRHYRIEQIIK